METLYTSVKDRLTINSSDVNVDSSPVTIPNVARDFRNVQLPETRMGLGSTEGDLIIMVKNYLEIVGLVFFVWLLGEWEIFF